MRLKNKRMKEDFHHLLTEVADLLVVDEGHRIKNAGTGTLRIIQFLLVVAAAAHGFPSEHGTAHFSSWSLACMQA